MAFELELLFALPDVQERRRITVGEGTTAGEAIQQAGWQELWQKQRGAGAALACFGRALELATVLSPGDRVEIVQALLTDPKEQRRSRAKIAARARRAR